METKPTIILTLCIIRQGERILLAQKKRGFGEGKWNGYGGKVDDGETLEEAMIREVKEESGLQIQTYSKRGVILFSFPEIYREVHIFEGFPKEYNPIETEEMRPAWFSLQAIPYDTMWPDDKEWLPLFLENLYFKGKFEFDEQDRIIAGSVWAVSENDLEKEE